MTLPERGALFSLLGKMCQSCYKFFGENDNEGLKSVLSKKRYPVITIVLYFNEERRRFLRVISGRL